MESSADTRSLIGKAKDGDRGAFGRLFKNYSGRIKSYIEQQLGTRLRQTVDVDDILGWTYLRAAGSIGQFRGQSEGVLVAWLLTIARRVIHDEARHSARWKPASLVDAVEARDPSPSKAARGVECFDRLQKAMNSLSKDHRRVLFLARVRGLPIKKVAEQMGRDYDATSQLLYRAGLKLKEEFGSLSGSVSLPAGRSLEEGEENEA